MAGQKFTDGVGSGINPPTENFAVWGDSDVNDGVVGTSQAKAGVFGKSIAAEGGHGVVGVYDGLIGAGVRGSIIDPLALGAAGVIGESSGRASGVKGLSTNGPGVWGVSDQDYGVIGEGGNIGVYATNLTAKENSAYLGTRGLAGDFYGDVFVHGNVFKAGGGFQIDHPIDPTNKYLQHSFVESSEMKNIYDGVVVLNAKGEAIVRLPGWFSDLNKDFRYQLTCIGKHSPVYIAGEIRRNQFKIAGGRSKLKVSWMITGIRKDAWANAHRISVEVQKPKHERGHFVDPQLFSRGQKKSIQRARYPEAFILRPQRKKQLDREKRLLATPK